jgi:hypothetical protein
MSKSFEPRFLCSKIHSSPHSCIPKFCAIFWEFFSEYLYHQNPLFNFLSYFNPENQLKLIFFYSIGFQPKKWFRPGLLSFFHLARVICHRPTPLLLSWAASRSLGLATGLPPHWALASGRPSRLHPLLSMPWGSCPTSSSSRNRRRSHRRRREHARAPPRHPLLSQKRRRTPPSSLPARPLLSPPKNRRCEGY